MNIQYKKEFLARLWFLLRQIEDSEDDLVVHLVEQIEENIKYLKKELDRSDNKKPSKEGSIKRWDL